MNMDNNDDVRFAVVSTLRRIFDETNSLKFLYLAEDSDIDETTDAGILKRYRQMLEAAKSDDFLKYHSEVSINGNCISYSCADFLIAWYIGLDPRPK